MSDPVVGAVIVKHIDELEAALRYAHDHMQPVLEKATAGVLEGKRRELHWAGDVPADFDETLWLAPEDWRMGGKSEDDTFYLSFSLETAPCIDGYEPDTWVGSFVGFAGAAIRFVFGTDAFGQREWKALLRAQRPLLDGLVAKGFIYEPKTGEIALTIPVNREALAAGFEDDTLEAALKPLIDAIDRINAARSMLDRLVEAIKLHAAP